MRQSVYKFYKIGTDSQKRADIVFDFKRPDREKVKDWTIEQKLLCRAYMNGVKERFDDFFKETLELIK